uniref:Microphthalmia-associated transcription factor n=1 Tax=Globodera pallida TaxID=36090 RepID=A0A183CPY6_GLOPA
MKKVMASQSLENHKGDPSVLQKLSHWPLVLRRHQHQIRQAQTVQVQPKNVAVVLALLWFQPQMLLNLKQSIHVEKQLTSNSDTSDSASEMGGPYEKPVLKASRLQHYQQQQQQKRKAARLQLLRQQSYQLAQKQSVLSFAQLSSNASGGTVTIPAQLPQAFHQQQGVQLQALKIEPQTMEEVDPEVEVVSPTSSGDRVPLSPIEDMKLEEVMDTS